MLDMSEGAIDINLTNLQVKIGEYRRAVETYYKAFGLYTLKDDEEINSLMEINQKIINSKNNLMIACQQFIDEA